jgi:non-ribosomal peptide synthetase component F
MDRPNDGDRIARMTPERLVTIGAPADLLIVILEANRNRAVDPGEAGEIGIAGVGVPKGYLNRPEQAKSGDFLALPTNPSGCIYCTGDPGGSTRRRIEYLAPHRHPDRRGLSHRTDGDRVGSARDSEIAGRGRDSA